MRNKVRFEAKVSVEIRIGYPGMAKALFDRALVDELCIASNQGVI